MVIVVALIFFPACSSFQRAKEPIKVDNLAYRIEAGLADAQFDKLFSSDLVRRKINVFYYTDDDIVCMEYNLRLTNYSLFWDEENRMAFIEALNRYKEDYSQHSLTKNYLRTKRKYGSVNSLIMWYTYQRSAQGIAYPKLEFGYYLKNKLPYFAITQREADNVSDVTRREQELIPNMILYFTRAQADIIAGIFDPDYLKILQQAERTSDAKQDTVPQAEIDY
ncbi:MAG: hypothetical protein FWH41_03880 [Treponema sp.]|nr:hypothetical protein [Treponema sp.]